MSEQSAWQSNDKVATGDPMAKMQGRRITADSFRMLAARLRKEEFVPASPVVPSAVVHAAVQEVVAPQPIPEIMPEIISAALHAEFAAPPPPPPPPTIFANLPPPPDLQWQPAATPFEEIFAAPAAPEAIAEPVEVAAEVFAAEVFAEPEQEQEPEYVAVETVMEDQPAEAVHAEPLLAVEVEAMESAEALASVDEPLPVAVELAPPPESVVEVEAGPQEPETPAEPETPVVLTADEIAAARAEKARVDREMLAIVHLIQASPSLEDRAAYLREVKEMARLAALEAELAAIAPPPAELLLPEEIAEIDVDQEIEEAPVARVVQPKSAAVQQEEEVSELARSLLDMMSSGGSSLPQERALAADTLLRLLPKLPLKAMLMLSERLSMMEQPSNLLVNKIIRDPRIEVAGYLLENCTHLSDQDLSQVIGEREVAKMRMIARRRKVSRTVSDQLLTLDDVSVMLTLVRNAGAEISHDGFSILAGFAQHKPDLLAPLCTRADLPAPVAFELFWQAPAQLRRYLLTRFLTDSETLSKILKITMATQGGDESVEGRTKITEGVQAALALVSGGKMEEGASALADIAQIDVATVNRIVNDHQGEPLAILLKAIGLPRGQVAGAIEILQKSDFDLIRRDRDVSELQNTFESLSFNKARVLITYWDWAMLKTGPYAPAN